MVQTDRSQIACWITKARKLIMKKTKSKVIITSENTEFSFIIIFNKTHTQITI
jgi:hypothetical protein